MTRPSSLRRALRERSTVIQSLFLALAGVGPDGVEVTAWVVRMRPIDAASLEAIAAKAREAGLAADVYT